MAPIMLSDGKLAQRVGVALAIGSAVLVVTSVIWALAVGGNSGRGDDGASGTDSSSSTGTTAPDKDSIGGRTNFLSSARGVTYFPDDDDILIGVGEQICFEVGDIGSEASRRNFAQSSYTLTQQNALWNAALANLC
jgi:hypothetical protein